MNFTIITEPIDKVDELASIPMAFEVRSIFVYQIQGGTIHNASATEQVVTTPYIKDYDAINNNGPKDWALKFDLSRWGFIAAHGNTGRIGGAVLAFGSDGVDMLEGRSDLAVLWDIRVAPPMRGRGVGSALFMAAESWAMHNGCVQLKIETQNNNVAACKFYSRMGCRLGAINRNAYPDLPVEDQLIWYSDLPNRRGLTSACTGQPDGCR